MKLYITHAVQVLRLAAKQEVLDILDEFDLDSIVLTYEVVDVDEASIVLDEDYYCDMDEETFDKINDFVIYNTDALLLHFINYYGAGSDAVAFNRSTLNEYFEINESALKQLRQMLINMELKDE